MGCQERASDRLEGQDRMGRPPRHGEEGLGRRRHRLCMDRFHAGEGHGYQGTPRRSERFRALQADASQATEGAHCQRRVGQVEVQEINELQHKKKKKKKLQKKKKKKKKKKKS